MQIPPIKNEDGSWARNNKQKAKRSVDHLEKIFHPYTVDDDKILPYVIEQEKMKIAFVTLTEIKKGIKTIIDPKKAPGFDLITGHILKELSRKALIKITNLIKA